MTTESTEEFHGAICDGGGPATRYVVAVREFGGRRYYRQGKPTRSRKAAIRRLAEIIEGGFWRSGGVWKCDEYYDPTMIYETKSL